MNGRYGGIEGRSAEVEDMREARMSDGDGDDGGVIM